MVDYAVSMSAPNLSSLLGHGDIQAFSMHVNNVRMCGWNAGPAASTLNGQMPSVGSQQRAILFVSLSLEILAYRDKLTISIHLNKSQGQRIWAFVPKAMLLASCQ